MGDEGRENTQEAGRTKLRSMVETKLDSQATNVGRERSEPKRTNDERIPSGYPVRPGQSSCRSYLHTGLCIRGSNCLFNHPRCKFFRRGFCKDGSDCKFLHEKDNEVYMPQTISRRRQETESSYWQEEKETKDWEKEQRHVQDNLQEQRQRENTQSQENVQRENTEGQRRETQENGQKHRNRDTTMWQRYFEKKRRENAHEQRLMENDKVDAHGQEDNLQVDRKRESIEWQTGEAQEMERRKSKAFLEEQRVKLEKKRQRDVEKLEIEAEESSEEHRLKVEKNKTETRSQSLFYCECKEKREQLLYTFSGEDYYFGFTSERKIRRN
ncbi:hypothetical protein N665_0518s0014 [Sinapis alba]|nr:hypothetical protein N665_0518s0014 [Sinapis alba]